MKINSITSYSITFGDQFFLDTNIWLYLLYPQQSKISERVIEQYSDFYNSLLSKNTLIKTHPIQISEYINAFIGIEYKKHQRANSNKALAFKDWKKQQAFEKVLKDVQTTVKSILKQSSLISGTFTPQELEDIAVSCDKADFNDLFFIRFAEKENLTLITHDKDFVISKNSNVEVLTNNQNLLLS